MWLRKKKIVPKRTYHDGDIVKFNFEPNSLDVECQEVSIIGVVCGVLYEKNGIYYKVQSTDKKRDIHGEFIIHEDNMVKVR